MSPPPSVNDFVAHCHALARHKPDATAYTWLHGGEREGSSWTFAELDRQARKVALRLEGLELRGARAALLYPPGLEFIAAFLGCLYAGVVAVPMNPPRNEATFRTGLAIARHAAPSVLLTESSLAKLAEPFFDALRPLPVLTTDRLARPADADRAPRALDPESLAFVQYTSGSTRAPRGVEVSHRNLFANEAMVRTAFGHDDDTVFVSWLPMFHDMGLVGNVLQPLYLGVQSVLMAPTAFVQKPIRWLRAISRYGGTTTGGPNFGYQLCVQRIADEDVATLDLSSWRVAYNGSEPVRASTLESFTEKFAPAGFRRNAFYPCYGLAEATLFVTGGRADEPARLVDFETDDLQRDRARAAHGHAPGGPEVRRLVGCGRGWHDQRVTIVDPATRRPLPGGAVGEIWLQGSNIARGYRDLPAGETDPFGARLADGEGPFLRTGDLGFLHEDELFVTGRLKDLVIQRGRNHYPQDIESCAAESHPFFRADHAAAFTVDRDGAERLVIVQEIAKPHGDTVATNANGLEKELVGAVRGALSHELGLAAWDVVFVEASSLPRTSSGKIQRRLCRKRWTEGTLPTLRPRPAPAAQN